MKHYHNHNYSSKMPRYSENTILEYFGEGEGHDCGYCKGVDTSISTGVWGHVVHARDYQIMIDRGWRRSGKYIYKPSMTKTCCPQYTIRCMAGVFKPSRSHKKALKKFRNYILHGDGKKGDEVNVPKEGEKEEAKVAKVNDIAVMDAAEDKVKMGKGDLNMETSPLKSPKTGTNHTSPRNQGDSTSNPMKSDEGDGEGEGEKKSFKSGEGADPEKPKSMKKKQMRIARALAKNPEKFKQKQKDRNTEVTLEDLTDMKSFRSSDPDKPAAHTFEIRLVRANTERDDNDPELDQRFLSSFKESFAVYKKYQVTIHKDEPNSVSERSYKRFLCNSSLVTNVPADTDAEGEKYSYGGFHQQYLIDGKIVAVGVVDILPTCVSSVYLYYDPDYAFLSFGTVSALFELAFTRSLRNLLQKTIRWYYMGYYIHSCPKMRYKAQYKPSQLLCPVTLTWHNLEVALPKLDEAKFTRFAKAEVEEDQGGNVHRILLLNNRRIMTYDTYHDIEVLHYRDEWWRELYGDLKHYAKLMGPATSEHIVLYRQ